MSGFVHSCELKGLWLLAQRLTNVSLYKYREFDKRNRIDKPCLCCCSTLKSVYCLFIFETMPDSKYESKSYSHTYCQACSHC